MMLKFINTYKVILIVFGALILNSCRKYEVLKDTDVIFFGHKGGGSNVYNTNFMENTLPSFKETLEFLDGIEFDIHMSLDGTIWIYHNHDLNDKSCTPPETPRYIPLMRDTEIEQNMLCEFGKSDRVYKFSEVIDFWNSTSRSFPMTIDIKISYPSEILAEMGGRNNYYQKLAKALADDIKEVENTHLIAFEFLHNSFMTELKKYDPTKNTLMFYSGDEDFAGHVNKAISGGYNGISLHYKYATKELIEEAKEMGLLVQLWTVYYNDEIKKVFDLSPDYIHTDNIFTKNLLRVK